MTKVRDANAAATNSCCSKWITRRTCVGLDVVAARRIPAWGNGDDRVCNGNIGHTKAPHHRCGDGHIRPRHQRRGEFDAQSPSKVRSDQHQRRDVLATNVAGHLHCLRSRGIAGGVGRSSRAQPFDHHRQMAPLATGLHRHTKRNQGIMQRTHRASTQRSKAVDFVVTSAKRTHRSDKARRGARQLRGQGHWPVTQHGASAEHCYLSQFMC